MVGSACSASDLQLVSTAQPPRYLTRDLLRASVVIEPNDKFIKVPQRGFISLDKLDYGTVLCGMLDPDSIVRLAEALGSGLKVTLTELMHVDKIGAMFNLYGAQKIKVSKGQFVEMKKLST